MERNMFVYKDNFGDDNKVALVLNMYRDNNNLYVGFEEYDEEFDFWSPFCDVTVNIRSLPYLESAINIELGGQEKIDFLTQNGFGELTDKKLRSGFLEFPVFRFNAEKLKELDPDFFSKYAKEHGRSTAERSGLDEQIASAEKNAVDSKEKISEQIQGLEFGDSCPEAHKAMTVSVAFSHSENECDETEFCINSFDKRELTLLFEDFCEENHLEDVHILSLEIVRTAETLEKLTEIEEGCVAMFSSLEDKMAEAESLKQQTRPKNDIGDKALVEAER